MNMGPKTLVCFVILVASEGLAADLANPLPADPFVWLEDVHGARAMDWVHAENAKTLDVLEKDPRYPALLASARAFAETPDRIPTPSFLGGQVQNLWQDPAHEHGIWRRTSLADFGNPAPHWQTLIDVDALARAEHANWFFKGANCEQPAERRCLVYLSDGGEDAGSWREFDVSTGRFITDGFNLPRGKQPTIWESRDALLVAREWHTGEVTVTGYPYILKRLQRGEPFSAAKIDQSIAALKRSAALVKANVPQVAIVCLVFAAIRIVASIMASVFVPRSALFVGSLVQDALLMLILPIPILGTVLLYLDIRRQTEGLDDAGVRAALAT